MRFSALLTLVLSLQLATLTGMAQTNTWTGSASTAWNTATNWSLGHTPLSTENVVIPSAPANQPVINGTISPVCNNLTIESGASLSIIANTINNALLNASGNATIQGSLTINGSFSKSGKLSVQSITWASGAVYQGNLVSYIDVAGDWQFSAGSAVSMGSTGVSFIGTANANIYSYSSGSQFAGVTINKGTGNVVYINAASTATLRFGGIVTITSGSLIGQANITTIFNNNITNAGYFSFNNGTVSLEKSSGTQTIATGTGNWFYNLTVNTPGTVTFSGTTLIRKDLLIQTGILDPLNNLIEIWGNWTNNAGLAGFSEGTGRVVFAGATGHQYCSNETFNILDVNKSTGALRMNGTAVTCARYDWTAGSLDVLGNGTFTALDLEDNGLYGGYYINSGSTMNLHQDAAQLININGTVSFSGGGTINIYGGGAASLWALDGNATVTMNGGTLDFKDQGFTVYTPVPYSLSVSISGGTIRTPGNVFCNTGAFDPTGGTVEVYGAGNTTLDVTSGWLRNLTVNKNAGSTVTLVNPVTINGTLAIDNGTFTADNKVITLGGHLNINDLGVFHIGPGSQLKLAGDMSISVNNGGRFECHGTLADNAVVTHSSGYYYFDINSGGTISARHTTFMYSYRIMVSADGIISPSDAFYHCTFMNFTSSSFLDINNSQTLSLHNVNFPMAPPVTTVSKSNNGGNLYFKDATGAFAGPAWEWDPYNRISWSASIPGRWTGEVSSNWFDRQNWDDYQVPTAAVNVTIPDQVTLLLALASDTVSCNNLTVLPGGTMFAFHSLVNVGGDLTIHGHLSFGGENQEIIVQGSVVWEPGSFVTTQNGVVRVMGDWTFNNGAEAVMTSGIVYFSGNDDANIFSHEANCAFYKVFSNKSGLVTVSNTSTDTLKLNSDLINSTYSSHFVSNSVHPIVLKQRLLSTGTFEANAGSVIFNGTDAELRLSSPGYFNHIDFRNSQQVWLSDSIVVKGNLTITGGNFVTNGHPVHVGGNWSNLAGSAAFVPSGGKVIFDGNTPSTILTGETFYNLEVRKTYVGIIGVQLNDSILVLNNFSVLQGTFEMNPASRLHVGNQLNIATGAGLNANDGDVKIYVADDWYDANTATTTTMGFNCGLYSIVYFLGKPANIQTINEPCPFNHVVVRSSGTYARPNGTGMNCRNLTLEAGTFRLYNYTVTVNETATVGGGLLRMDTSNDSLIVQDIVWQAGSNDLVTLGVILVNGNWTFEEGTLASLGTGNMVVFGGLQSSYISCHENTASMGSVVIGKTVVGFPGPAVWFEGPADTLNVAGSFRINDENNLWIINANLVTEGLLDIEPSGILWVNNGYVLNRNTVFSLRGKIYQDGGTIISGGMFHLDSTGFLSIGDGVFRCDAPVTTDWLTLEGHLHMDGGMLDLYNHSVKMTGGFIGYIDGGTIRVGYAFSAETGFSPGGGKVLMVCPGPGPYWIYMEEGCHFNDLEIDGKVGLATPVVLKDDLLITSGFLQSNNYTITIGGDWENLVGDAGFSEGVATVTFNTTNPASILSDETFWNLTVAKTMTGLDIQSSHSILVKNDLTLQASALDISGDSVAVNNDVILTPGGSLTDLTGPGALSLKGDWINQNTIHDASHGCYFTSYGSRIFFNGITDQFLTTEAPAEYLPSLEIHKITGSFRTNDNIECDQSLLLRQGVWEDNVPGLCHKVSGNFDVLNAPGTGIINGVSQNTFEFRGGPADIGYHSTTGSFHHVVINKTDDYFANLTTNLNCLFDGNLTIQSGILNAGNYRVWVEGNIAVNAGGWMRMHLGSELVMTEGNSLDVNSGGQLDILGSTLRADPSSARYDFNIHSGGTLDAQGCVIRNTGLNGLYLMPGSILLDDFYSPGLYECTFSEGDAGGTLLRIDNDQELTLRNIQFPANTWGGTSNVLKTVNSGQVYLVDYSGDFSGEAFDEDNFGRIDWVPVLTATATAQPAVICSGSSTQLNVATSGGLAPYAYFWSPQTGLSDPFTSDPIASPTTTTTYNLIVSDALETQIMTTVTVTVLPVLPVSVTIAASANPSPPGNFVLFTATPVNGGTNPAFQWKVNGINTGSGMATYSYVPSNGDEVTCLVTSNYQCPSGNPATSNTITMAVVNTNTTVNGTVPSPLDLCFDATNTITVAGSGTIFLVQAGGSATFIAGQRIYFLPGTTVQAGGYMHGYISDIYCGGQLPSMVTVTGQEEPAVPATASYRIYPNPVTENFTLECLGALPESGVRADIYSMKGERLRSVILHEPKQEISFGDAPAGLYFVKIQAEGKLEVIKLVKGR